MKKPLVTVVCISYQHRSYIREALDSVISQSYPEVEIIIADDHSTDGTVAIIEEYAKAFPQLKVLYNQENEGNCRTFNKALALSTGKYIIDFSTDDVMLPDRIETQVAAMEALDDTYTMCFTDAVYINAQSELLANHYRRNADGSLMEPVPDGDVYAEVVQRYFICTPTMMMNTAHLKAMGGYDETLTYEDFDYWVRAARIYKFHYIDQVLTAKRIIPRSKSGGFYQKGNPLLQSTYEVCRKALALNSSSSETEHKALETRVRHEFRQAVLSENRKEALLFYQLLQEMKATNLSDKVFITMAYCRLPMRFIWQQRMQQIMEKRFSR